MSVFIVMALDECGDEERMTSKKYRTLEEAEAAAETERAEYPEYLAVWAEPLQDKDYYSQLEYCDEWQD